MNKFDLNSYLSFRRNKINSTLALLLKSNSNDNKIRTAMEYSLMSGGKRLRPILCMAATEAVGGQSDDTLRTACALEMIHTYSLIHDDLPAMDNDLLRRGQSTCHIAFDEATAILAGDALLTLAFEILSSVDFTNKDDSFIGLTVIHKIASAAGHKGMIEGQMQDIAAEGKPISPEDLEKMYALKTGALIESSIISGAILGKGDPKQIERLETYAKNFGLAFQVTDDILDVEGDPEIMGKDAGSDKARKKSTYPSILGMKKTKKIAKILINNALNALDYFDNKADPLRAIAHYIVDRRS